MALKDIIGQEQAVSILLGTRDRNRMPAAYLFAGESGIGKKFTAINLAKTINCLKAVTSNVKGSNKLQVKSNELNDNKSNSSLLVTRNSLRVTDDVTRSASGESAGADDSSLLDCCDECPSCKKIDSGIHPDFLMVSPEKGEIRVDEIRKIEEALSFAPYEAKRKIVIVDDAETMNPSAANAFLKTLEEPPAQSIIILICASPDRLPETIRSRCARINFSPLSPEKCEEAISKAWKSRSAEGQKDKSSFQSSELPDFQTSALSTVARLSMGRPGLAISSDLLEERSWFLGLLENMAEGLNKETWADKEEIELWLNNAFMLLRDIAVLKITGKSDMLINTDLKNRLPAIIKTAELKDIIDIYDKLSLLKVYLGFNLNKAITWNYVAIIMQNLKFKKQN